MFLELDSKSGQQYIKMCDCPEIQDEWKPRVGDCCWHQKHGMCLVEASSEDYVSLVQLSDGECEIAVPRIDVIWLLRQDQLWKMLPPLNGKFVYLIFCLNDDGIFWKFYKLHHIHGDTVSDFYIVSCESAEEALIKGLMQELHKKEWTGERWQS